MLAYLRAKYSLPKPFRYCSVQFQDIVPEEKDREWLNSTLMYDKLDIS